VTIATNSLSLHNLSNFYVHNWILRNRWGVLADYIQWDDFAVYYYSKMDRDMEAQSKNALLVLRTLTINHFCNLSDESTIFAIQENVYIHDFVGLRSFTINHIFDSSLFVTIRKRLNQTSLDKMVVTVEYKSTCICDLDTSLILRSLFERNVDLGCSFCVKYLE
jgi:hypothetical protein